MAVFLSPLTITLPPASAGPWMVRHVSVPLERLGAISLECYLLQFHLYLVLAQQDRSILVVLPGYPILNMATLSAVYVAVAARLFRVTKALYDEQISTQYSALPKWEAMPNGVEMVAGVRAAGRPAAGGEAVGDAVGAVVGEAAGEAVPEGTMLGSTRTLDAPAIACIDDSREDDKANLETGATSAGSDHTPTQLGPCCSLHGLTRTLLSLPPLSSRPQVRRLRVRITRISWHVLTHTSTLFPTAQMSPLRRAPGQAPPTSGKHVHKLGSYFHRTGQFAQNT